MYVQDLEVLIKPLINVCVMVPKSIKSLIKSHITPKFIDVLIHTVKQKPRTAHPKKRKPTKNDWTITI